MKSLNRTLSLVLVLVMVLGLIGVAGAADFKDKADIKNDEAVNTMAALNIIKGKDTGNFDPTGSVTRGEMAKMICVALNGGKEPVLGTTANPTYTDIKGHWAAGYIEYCSTLGIVAGVGDGTFAPNLAVTGSQAAKMMLVAMNYDATVFGFTGANWENAVNTEANKAGLYEDLSIDASAALSRDNAAQLIYNGINANTMKVTWQSNGTKTYEANGDSLAEEKFELRTNYGVMTDAGYNSTDEAFEFDFDNTLAVANEFSGTVNSTFQTASNDYSAYYGMQVKVLWTVNSKGDTVVYGVYPYKSTVMLSGVLGQLADATMSTSEIKFNGTTYKFDQGLTTTEVWNFGADKSNSANRAGYVYSYYAAVTAGFAVKAADASADYSAAIPASYIFKAVDTNGNGKINFVVVYPYAVAKVAYVGADSVRVSNVITGVSATLDFDDAKIYDGIKKNDFVKVTAEENSANSIDTLEKLTVANGKVTAIAADETKATINGMALGSLVDVSVGDTYDYVMVNGFIWDISATATVASAKDYAVVKAAADDDYNTHTAKLLFSDGTTKQVETKNDYSSAGTDLAGQLVTYKISSDKYELTPVTTKGDFDERNVVSAASDFDATKNTLCDNPIADDAVIFVQKTTGATTLDGYKVITGKQLKDTSAIAAVDVVPGTANWVALGNTNSSTGYSTVLVAYVQIHDGATTGDENYGYVTKALTTTTNADDEIVSSVTFWNGKEEVTKLTTTDVSATLGKGNIFSYTMDGEDIVVTTPVTGLTKGYIKSVDGKNIAIYDEAGTLCTNDEISDDTVVMYIDSAEFKGYADYALDIADGTTPNVYFIKNGSDDDFTLIVYDVDNDMNANSTTYVGDANQTILTALFAKYDEVTITGNVSTITDIAAGKTLYVGGNITTVTDNHGIIGVAGNIGTVTANSGKIILTSDTATITTLTANTGAIVVAGAKLTITNAVGTSAYLQGVVAFAAGVQLDIKADTTAGTGYDADKDAATFSVAGVAVADDAKVLTNVYTAVGTLNDTVWTVA